ncbi:MAG TPA: sigma 54-interacting transcriptional regulator [Kofleriaceae bacterium]|nr:sigma 54-interacting transcriptional regulator [Kofleriaceae bacterium]
MRTTVTDAGESPSSTTGWVLLVSRDADFRAYGLPDRGDIAIGREAGCEVVIDHEKISRRHAILRLADRWSLEDLGSRNGTQIRGAAVAAGTPAEVAPGEPFQIGPFTAVVLARAVSTVRAALGASHITIDDPMLTSPGPLVLSLAQSMVNVLVAGETGVGKEVLSSSLHRLSGRNGALVCINCAALSPQLLESELFGHERGAFTGAAQTKPGLLEAASGGTVLFDEIGEMPLELQAKLLRAIETREVLRVGAVRPVTLDVRVLAATNRDLLRCVAEGSFRRDLFYRLAGITLNIPPLRDRLQQLEPLAAKFARAATGKDAVITAVSLGRLRSHSWPGNVRELKNVVERAALLAAGGPIQPEHILLDQSPAELQASGGLLPSRTVPGTPLAMAASKDGGDTATAGLTPDQLADRQKIVAALEACNGNQTRAAQQLGISRATLVNKLSIYRVPRPRK